MGDCGAFQYVREPCPPYTVDEVIDFYEGCGVDAGISLDHVILGFELARRRSATTCCRRNGRGAASSRSNSPRSSSRATASAAARSSRSASPRAGARRATRSRSGRCRTLGYERIAIGGLVAQKTHEILAVLEAIDEIREPAGPPAPARRHPHRAGRLRSSATA